METEPYKIKTSSSSTSAEFFCIRVYLFSDEGQNNELACHEGITAHLIRILTAPPGSNECGVDTEPGNMGRMLDVTQQLEAQQEPRASHTAAGVSWM